MNGVTGATMSLPATTVLRLTGERPVTVPQTRNAEADEALLAAVTHPPRVGEVRPIAALMPDVLARYGLTKGSASCEAACESNLDCYA
ncbi:MAG TPA: hypothetical protein VKH44_14070 [Pirellulaceae bacterium]|nr:hypothetical protein [Pirellulaceae bacterium]